MCKIKNLKFHSNFPGANIVYQHDIGCSPVYGVMQMMAGWLTEHVLGSHCCHVCRAAAKRSPGRQMQPTKQLGDSDILNYSSDWRPKNFWYMSDRPRWCSYVWCIVIKICISFVNIAMSDNPNLVWTTQHTNWVVRWVTQEFLLAAALCMSSQVSADHLKIWSGSSRFQLQMIGHWDSSPSIIVMFTRVIFLIILL